MAALAVGLTGVDGVFEIETFADGVALDDFVAHCQRLKDDMSVRREKRASPWEINEGSVMK